MVDAPLQQPTGPEEILWSARDRLIDLLPLASASTCHLVSDLDDVSRTLQNHNGFMYLIEGGDVLPIEGEGWEGGDICNLTSMFRFTVDIWKVSIVDLPVTTDYHAIEPQDNLYTQAALVIHAIGGDLLKQRDDSPLPIGSENPTPRGCFYTRDGNTKACLRIPFDQKFDWDVSAYTA